MIKISDKAKGIIEGLELAQEVISKSGPFPKERRRIRMTKEQFKEGYMRRSGLLDYQYDQSLVTMECHCSADNCKGWASVANNTESIKIHEELYG